MTDEKTAMFKIDRNPFPVSARHYPYATFERRVNKRNQGFLLLSVVETVTWEFIASHKTFEDAEQSLGMIDDPRLPSYR